MSDPARIRQDLGGPGHRRLFEAVRLRLERAGAGEARSLTLEGCDPAERAAIADLFGWAEVPEGAIRIRLPELDAALRRSALDAGLREVVEALGGPLRDLPGLRRSREESVAALRRRAEEHPALTGREALRPWAEELFRRGLLARVARERGLRHEDALELLMAAAARLPAPGVLLPVFAAELCGDAHALDAGRPLAAAVLRAAARLAGWPDLPESALARRQLWSEVGIACDALSADVLVLGLRPAGDTLLAARLRAAASAGEPQRVTLRELAGGLEVDGQQRVFVCENPSVVAAAADRLGARSAPLICLDGVPSTAALRLLRALERSGARSSFHADFDWAGVRIGNLLHSQRLAEPWRFDAKALGAAKASGVRGPPLSGDEAEATWDPGLRPALREAGHAVLEEQVLEHLMADLADAAT